MKHVCKWCGKTPSEVQREDNSLERCVGKRNAQGELITSSKSLFYSGHHFEENVIEAT